MKLSKEARIGLLTASAIFIFFIGFYFLKGANVFSGEYDYYVYYENVQGLQASSPVQIKGMSVGRVSDIQLNGGDKVQVTITVNKDIKIPQGSIARLISTDLLGTKAVALEMSNQTNILEDQSELIGAIEGGVLDAVSVEITPLLKDIRHAIGTLDTLLIGISGVLDVGTRENLRNSIASLEATMYNFSSLSKKLNQESDQIASVIRNTNEITQNLANNNDRVSNILKNLEHTTGQLAAAPVEQTLRNMDEAIVVLTNLMEKINNNEGSMGMLIHDKALYQNITSSLETLNNLMADIQAHPSRYINVTIFGRKKKD